jgi:hypothetical protein
MQQTDCFAPRALLRKHLVTVQLSPFEACLLVAELEGRACRYMHDAETVDVAQHWFDRVAYLREAMR